MKSVVVDSSAYDWEGDAPLHRPSARTVIYEMHVRGFTRHPNSGVKEQIRGTYAGLVEKIPYLKDLGITAVELLPIHAFDTHACPPGLVNYWGYQSVSYFAPHPQYSSRRDPLGPVNEFRDMVKALHRAGIEVILDVVYNHTAEGNHDGPTLCFKGIDNPTYYILEDGGSRYADYTGCGNTLNANHPVVRRMIVDSLRYWVTEMHVDGFRFDLASILSRDSIRPPAAEPAGAVGHRVGPGAGRHQADRRGVGRGRALSGRQFRRRRVEGVERPVPRRRPRLLPRRTRLGRAGSPTGCIGSHEVYGHKGREAEQSVNFVTCHDGFTPQRPRLRTTQKHNEANGEENRDGANDNKSWNCGVEGPTDDPAVEVLRNRQVKNFHAVTLLSIGLPMILMGDEVRRTQGGNNNFYCHDNEANWFDWSLVEKHADVHRFVKLLLARRLLRDVTHEEQRVSLTEMIEKANKAWHGVKLNQPDWGEGSHSIAFGAELKAEKLLFHLILNGYWEPLDFELPPTADGKSVATVDRHLAAVPAGHRRVDDLPRRCRAIPTGPDRARWSCSTQRRIEPILGFRGGRSGSDETTRQPVTRARIPVGSEAAWRRARRSLGVLEFGVLSWPQGRESHAEYRMRRRSDGNCERARAEESWRG